jgi:hypothetical protein
VEWKDARGRIKTILLKKKKTIAAIGGPQSVWSQNIIVFKANK